MKNKLKARLVALALASSLGVANAGPAVWGSLYNPADFVLENGDAAVTYTHDLLAEGYNPATDTITSASLTFWMYDDSLWDKGEKVSFNFDSQGWSASTEVNGFGLNLGWLDDFLHHTITFNSLSSLLNDGMLQVSLLATGGDFVFDKSLLLAYGHSKVPEPATVALLGAGLIGIALLQRRRRRTSI